ncbi:sugar phosphate nucleotidyltransferase [Halococcus qingdaonensis]|uniref:phosphocholine cytidylyltransferase family protein n=1 Tax=Halococcus qingdaonensis TaxID=224402 RepID=UPI0021160F71|nr:phosphocholine cytidylyltransferase family protein [Halococcus qingdaonensis]
MNGRRQAIVLAAGQGKRLRPLTDETPKTLLNVGEHAILEHILQALETTGYERVVVVTGFGNEQIETHCQPREELDVEFVHNDQFASTNNIYSLWLAKEYALDGFTLINSDTIFSAASLSELQDTSGSALLVDTEKELDDEEMQVAFGLDTISDISKEIDGDGEYIGVAKFTAEHATTLFEHIEEFIERDAVNDWYEAAFDRLFDDADVGFVRIDESWAEIDTPDDLEHAREQW